MLPLDMMDADEAHQDSQMSNGGIRTHKWATEASGLTSRTVAISVMIPKLGSSSSWKHQEVAMDAAEDEREWLQGMLDCVLQSLVHTRLGLKILW